MGGADLGGHRPRSVEASKKSKQPSQVPMVYVQSRVCYVGQEKYDEKSHGFGLT
jgi:hypothetical protein